MNAPHELNYAYTYLALSAFIFLVLNLPVPIGKLTPAASSIFNIVSSVTLLSPWGAGFPCVHRESVSVHHTALSCFFFFFFFFLNVLIKPILMGFTQSCCQTALQTTVLDRFVFKLRQRSSVLYRKMSHIPNIAVVVVVNCQTLKITFNRNQPTTGRINPNTQLTYHVDVDIHSNTEKLNCRHSFDT